MPASWSVPSSGTVPPAGGSAVPSRTGRGRRALVVVAGLACLLLGGAGGWALGHATGGSATGGSGSGGPAPAGSVGPGSGVPGGGFDGDGGGFRHHGFPGTGPQDGTGDGTGGTGGTGGTLGGAGTGGTGDGGTV